MSRPNVTVTDLRRDLADHYSIAPVDVRELSSYDDRMFSDWRQCTLKPRANMAELKAVFAEMEQMARDNGMGGYAVHFFTPYRGMQDELPYDFLMSYIWFTSEARSAGVANWPEWNAMMEESGLYKKRDKHIEGRIQLLNTTSNYSSQGSFYSTDRTIFN